MARWILVAAAFVAFLPAVPSWWIAWRYHRIPTQEAGVLARVHETAPGAPPLTGAEAVGAAPDGTWFVADWALRHVVAVRPPAPGRWLPAEGRFLPRVDTVGRLHLLDVDSGVLYRFTPEGRLDRRVAVAPPNASPLFCLAPDGRLLVAAGGVIRRFREELAGLDPSWGPPPHAVPARATVGLAASAERVYAASRDGTVSVYSPSGDLVGRQPLVGNAGALDAGPDGRILLADNPTGRVFVLDREGRTVGRLVSPEGTAPAPTAADLGSTADRRLAVAAGRSLVLLALPAELP